MARPIVVGLKWYHLALVVLWALWNVFSNPTEAGSPGFMAGSFIGAFLAVWFLTAAWRKLAGSNTQTAPSEPAEA